MAYGHPSHNWNPFFVCKSLFVDGHPPMVSRLVVCFILLEGVPCPEQKGRETPMVKTWSKRLSAAFTKDGYPIRRYHLEGNSFCFNRTETVANTSLHSLHVGWVQVSPTHHDMYISRLSSKVTWRQTHPQIGIQSLNLWKRCCWCCSRSPHHCCDLTANVALAHNSSALANYNAKWIQSLWLSKHLQLQMTFKIKRESIWTEILPEDILSKFLGFYMACSREARRTDRLGHDTLAAAEPRIAASHLATHQFLTRGANMQRPLSGKAGKRFLFWFQMEF